MDTRRCLGYLLTRPQSEPPLTSIASPTAMITVSSHRLLPNSHPLWTAFRPSVLLDDAAADGTVTLLPNPS